MKNNLDNTYKRAERTILIYGAIMIVLLLSLPFLIRDDEKSSSFQHLNNNTIQINDTLFVTMPDGDTAKFIIKRYE